MTRQAKEQEMKHEPMIEVHCPVCDKVETFTDAEGMVGVCAWQCDCGLEITLIEDDDGYSMHIQQMQRFDRPRKKSVGMDELIRNIEGWAIDKGLDKADPIKQLAKLMEEIGELAEGLVKVREEQVVDSIGDSVVVLTILALQMGYDIQDCVQVAYDEIKGRTGKMVNGVFVKSEDLEG